MALSASRRRTVQKKRFEENVEFDAQLVKAAMHGMLVPLAMGLNMTPNEVQARAEWLQKKPKYLDRVTDHVIALEISEKKVG